MCERPYGNSALAVHTKQPVSNFASYGFPSSPPAARNTTAEGKFLVIDYGCHFTLPLTLQRAHCHATDTTVTIRIKIKQKLSPSALPPRYWPYKDGISAARLLQVRSQVLSWAVLLVQMPLCCPAIATFPRFGAVLVTQQWGNHSDPLGRYR